MGDCNKMVSMKMFTLAIVLLFSSIDPSLLQGTWKLHEDESMLKILTSQMYKNMTSDEQQQLSDSFQFALDSTFYRFEGDSIYFTDA